MKGVMKGKLLKKLKSIPPIGYLKPDRILHVNAWSEGNVVESNLQSPSLDVQTELTCKDMEPKKVVESSGIALEPDIIDVAELMKDLEDEDMDFDEEMDNKENIGPPREAKDAGAFQRKSENSLRKEPEFRQNIASEASESGLGNSRKTPLSEIDILSFRKPDLNSSSLFDPNLLAAFEEAVKEHNRISEQERKARTEHESPDRSEEEEEDEPPSKARRVEEDDPLLGFEEKCPPGAADSVILYTTTLRGIRKTFEECNSIRFLLESFRVIFYERDVSMHMEFKEEMWRILDSKSFPPRLFIRGRYIGGAEEVLTLHEQGKLRPLFQGVPVDYSNGACEGCAGVRFVLCFNCNGSHRVVADDGKSNTCEVCNENGLIICPYCC